ncbi:hypothetical protein DL93DRAFT_2102415 [Clavulina sp. PMI_390]|nr:hypothetical protein DL93DRAFT_2102415 [Clavulina sp. PMI_390]
MGMLLLILILIVTLIMLTEKLRAVAAMLKSLRGGAAARLKGLAMKSKDDGQDPWQHLPRAHMKDVLRAHIPNGRRIAGEGSEIVGGQKLCGNLTHIARSKTSLPAQPGSVVCSISAADLSSNKPIPTKYERIADLELAIAWRQ